MDNDNIELSLDDIHDIEFDLLIKIKKICEKIGVKYYLAYGTLLGAARHQSFIPWDDDVDIWMLRDDYNKFFEYLKIHSQELYPLSFCSRAETKNYPYGINRVTDMRYKYVDVETHYEADYGVFVDVYPLDKAGNTKDEYDRMYKNVEKLNFLWSTYIQAESYSGNRIKAVVKHLINRALHILVPDETVFYERIESKIKKILLKAPEQSSRLGVVVWWAYIHSYDKAHFEGSTSLLINGESFNAPQNYKEILETIYGDYMKLPPVEKRVSHHGYRIYKREQP